MCERNDPKSNQVRCVRVSVVCLFVVCVFLFVRACVCCVFVCVLWVGLEAGGIKILLLFSTAILNLMDSCLNSPRFVIGVSNAHVHVCAYVLEDTKLSTRD